MLAANGLFSGRRAAIGECGPGDRRFRFAVRPLSAALEHMEADGQRNGYVVLGAALFSFFSATGNPAIFDSFGWWGYISALLCWFCLFYAALECCFSIADRTEL